MTTSEIQALNTIVDGWSESRPGGLLCNPAPQGAIIDCTFITDEWFVVFNDGRETLQGYDTRDDAIEAYAAAMRPAQGSK